MFSLPRPSEPLKPVFSTSPQPTTTCAALCVVTELALTIFQPPFCLDCAIVKLPNAVTSLAHKIPMYIHPAEVDFYLCDDDRLDT